MLDRFGLRWSVSKQPLLLQDGTITKFSAIVRDDNKDVFTTCKDGYVPYQNSELAELLLRISEKTGYEIHSGGEFNGGGKVYLQLNTKNEINGIGKNKTSVKGFVTGINGHDGTTSLKWGAVNFTICCSNTFASAKGKLQNTARHTASIHDRVESSIREIEGVTLAEKTIFEQFIKLSQVQVTKDNIASIVKAVTKVDINTTKDKAEEIYGSYAVNRSSELISSIAREIEQKGETLWGLFSGVTHYTSHVMPVQKRDNARLESKYIGNGASIDNDSFASIVKMARI
jgi:phage/plasmid-like protein (TIGR03299 family)